MRTITCKALLAGLFACGAMTAHIDYAHAQWMGGKMDTGLYLGGGIGQSRSEIDTSGFVGSSDDNDTGWKLFAGFEFNRYVSIEAGYYDLGTVTFSGATAPPVFPVGLPVNGNFKTKAYAVSVVGSLPVWDSFALLARLGVARGDQKGTVTTGGVVVNASDDNTDITFGLGLRYDFNRNFGVRAQWEHFKVGGDNVGGKNDVNLYSVDVFYRFGM